MTHLSPAEVVDEIEGRLPEARRVHLEVCPPCASRITDAREGVEAASHADIPEPSPLFWQHFSSRVREAVRDETPERPAWWQHGAWAIPCSVVFVVAVLIGVRGTGVSPSVGSPAPPPVAHVDAAAGDDPAWNLLADVASAMEQEDPQSSPVTVRPSEVDRAVLEMSPAERQELQRLLEGEMKRSGD